MPVYNPKSSFTFPLLVALTLALLAASPAFAQQASNSGTIDAHPAAPLAKGAAPNSPPAGTPAQSNVQAAPGGLFTFKTSVNEVVLYVTVIDRHQHLITTLTRKNFTVYENNARQTITSFRLEDVPVSMAILIDNSGSMAGNRAAVNRAAIDLVRASNPQDEAFIVNFSDEAYLDQDFTSNVGLLKKGLSHIDSTGGTALYDAVIAAADHLAKHAKHAKQVILIITDGEDNSSSATLGQTVRRVQGLSGPIVYSIGLLYDEPSGQGHRARKALQTLSDQTGGIAFFPKSLDQVDAIAGEVARDIREQYIVGYHPAQPIRQGGYRSIRVEAKAKGLGKLTARTRAGYFAQPQADARTVPPGSAHP